MPAALAIPAIIGAAGSIGSALIGSHAAKSAATVQAQAAQQVAGMATKAATSAQAGASAAVKAGQTGVGAATNTGIQDVENASHAANTALHSVASSETSNLNPYLQAGKQGVSTLADMLKPGGQLTQQFSFNPTDLQNDPGYQFMLQQGTKALNNSASARGLLGSGATLKAITNYGQGLAGTEYQNAYNRALTSFQTNRQNTLQGLGMLTGYGQNATNQYQQALQNYGNLSSGNTMNAGQYAGNLGMQGSMFSGNLGLQGAEYAGTAGLQGAQIAGQALEGGANAQAAGTVGAANAWQTGLGGLANAGQMFSLGNYLNNQPMGNVNPNFAVNLPPGYDASGGIPGGLPPFAP